MTTFINLIYLVFINTMERFNPIQRPVLSDVRLTGIQLANILLHFECVSTAKIQVLFFLFTVPSWVSHLAKGAVRIMQMNVLACKNSRCREESG